MKTMRPKERVLAAINHVKPDRIPMDLGSTNCTTMTLKAYQNLKRFLGINAPDELIMKNFQIVAIDEDTLNALEIDTRGIHGKPPARWHDIVIDENTYISEWGIKYHMPEGGLYYDMVENPLKGKNIEYLDEFKWPDPEDPGRIEGLRERAAALHREGKYAIVGDMIETGIFEPCWYLRGFEDFLMDLMINKDFARALMRKMVDCQLRRYEVFLDAVGEYLDIVFVGDDLATAQSTIMSVDLYREMVKPFQKEYFAGIKSMTKAKLLYHSCGNIMPFLDDLVEIGVDILDPVQVSAQGMDTKVLKERWGDKLCFWGAIDTSYVLPKGTPDEVAAEVRRRVAELGPEGYVVNSVHDIQPDVPPENVVAMFRAAKEIVL